MNKNTSFACWITFFLWIAPPVMALLYLYVAAPLGCPDPQYWLASGASHEDLLLIVGGVWVLASISTVMAIQFAKGIGGTRGRRVMAGFLVLFLCMGVAVALALQDTLANFFGSVFIFIDRPFVIGDMVRIGDTDGVVEQIGFRSTRIRTWPATLVAIPNKQVG
nr:mechanosensitive ion channel [Candidatus Sigynarchaeota archaeon]